MSQKVLVAVLLVELGVQIANFVHHLIAKNTKNYVLAVWDIVQMHKRSDKYQHTRRIYLTVSIANRLFWKILMNAKNMKKFVKMDIAPILLAALCVLAAKDLDWMIPV